MLRLVVPITFLVLGVAQATDVIALHTVNLNVPEAIEELGRTNPKHYDKVRQIMAGLHERSGLEVERWIRTTFKASDVQYTQLFLVSAPPKRRLSFTIDNTRYEAVITLTDNSAL